MIKLPRKDTQEEEKTTQTTTLTRDLFWFHRNVAPWAKRLSLGEKCKTSSESKVNVILVRSPFRSDQHMHLDTKKTPEVSPTQKKVIGDSSRDLFGMVK